MKSKYLITLFTAVIVFSSFLAKGQDKQKEKIVAATNVLQDFGKMQESIPSELLKVTQGIIIVPQLINAGFVLAGKRGKGIAMVKLQDGTWSNPVFVTITGGSLGFQAGVQSIDLVLIFKTAETLLNIGNGSFTLGGDISVTAGPVGRNSSAGTDYKMEAEVYSYSKSKGLFAGISISGSAIDIETKYNQAFYENETDAKEIFESTKVKSPEIKALKTELKKLYVK